MIENDFSNRAKKKKKKKTTFWKVGTFPEGPIKFSWDPREIFSHDEQCTNKTKEPIPSQHFGNFKIPR